MRGEGKGREGGMRGERKGRGGGMRISESRGSE